MVEDAYAIIRQTIQEIDPGLAVQKALAEMKLQAPLIVIAVGKAAWTMAAAAQKECGNLIKKGIVITKYQHCRGPLENFELMESGHPVPDEASVRAAARLMEIMEGLSTDDRVLFLISGGGSSLVEYPEPGISLAEIQEVTNQLLRSGADIKEMNVIRKKLSAIKGGKLVKRMGGRMGDAIVLSDVVGNHPDMIASGLTCSDTATGADALKVLKRYRIPVSEKLTAILKRSEPVIVDNIRMKVIGSVDELCKITAKTALRMGYTPHILTTALSGEARVAGYWMGSLAGQINNAPKGIEPEYLRPCAVIAGGETTVTVKGEGMGGRNQEIALSAALCLKGQKDVLLFSYGSDGTDGPTDAAGGIVDGFTCGRMKEKGIDPDAALTGNDSYHALKEADSLIITGATGTNINDVTVLLMK